MSLVLTLAQVGAESSQLPVNPTAPTTEDMSSSAVATIFGVFAFVGILSLIGVASKSGRRVILPVVAILLGAAIVVSTISVQSGQLIAPFTAIGVFIGLLVGLGGLGALREGMAVPTVEGIEPEIRPHPPRVSPDS